MSQRCSVAARPMTAEGAIAHQIKTTTMYVRHVIAPNAKSALKPRKIFSINHPNSGQCDYAES